MLWVMRPRASSEALAAHAAALFRGLLRPVAADHAPSQTIDRFDYALTHLDRRELWELYAQARFQREATKQIWWEALGGVPDIVRSQIWRCEAPTPTPTLPFFQTANVWAFLTRAAIAPASALRGRATAHVRLLIEEGLRHAAFVLEPRDVKRRDQLFALWTANLDDLGSLDDLDRGQEPRYVPSDAQ